MIDSDAVLTDGQVLKRRIEKGWTPEQIIETPIVASVN